MSQPAKHQESPLGEPRSVFEEAEAYDVIFDFFRVDLPFWLGFADRGPVLDLGCGTGRVTIPLLQAGLEVDGLDLWEPMLARLRAKAEALGFAPRLHRAPMQRFQLGRRYERILCAFNAFAHNLTREDQLSCLRSCRDHLAPGGALAIYLSLPPASMWLEPDDVPVLEIEVPHPARGTRLQMLDTRTKNRVEQTQHSEIELRELSADGKVVSSRRSSTDLRWIGKPEMELLLLAAGLPRYEIFGGYGREALTAASNEMIVVARSA
jgi:SAM-dependent methyltransferase